MLELMVRLLKGSRSRSVRLFGEKKHQEEGEFDEEEGKKLTAKSICTLSGQLNAQLVARLPLHFAAQVSTTWSRRRPNSRLRSQPLPLSAAVTFKHVGRFVLSYVCLHVFREARRAGRPSP